MLTRLIMFFIGLICLIFIVSLSRSIYTLWQKGALVDEQQQLLDEKVRKSRELEQKLRLVQGSEFVEREAREKLNLQREGEVVVVIPQNVLQGEGITPTEKTSANWYQWWKLFF